MSWRTGFLGNAPCPQWLVGCQGFTIVPLAQRQQTNPIYQNRPGDNSQGRVKLTADCATPVYAKRFELCEITLAHGKKICFVSAEVDVGYYGILNGWINIWMGDSAPSPFSFRRDRHDGKGGKVKKQTKRGKYCRGTLYCTLVANAALGSGYGYWLQTHTPRIADEGFAPCLCGRCLDKWLAQGWVCGSYKFEKDLPAAALEMSVGLDTSSNTGPV